MYDKNIQNMYQRKKLAFSLNSFIFNKLELLYNKNKIICKISSIMIIKS